MSPLQPKLRLAPHGQTSRPIPAFDLLAFDPGGTTGWAHVHCDGGMPSGLTMDDFKLTVGELGPEEHHEELWGFLNGFWISYPHTLHIVTESFNFRQFATDGSSGKAKVELISCEYIGIIKLFAERNEVPCVSYNSSEGKGFATDMKLEAMGWFQTPKTPKRHMNDAIRQAVCYMVKRLRIHSPITDSWRG